MLVQPAQDFIAHVQKTTTSRGDPVAATRTFLADTHARAANNAALKLSFLNEALHWEWGQPDPNVPLLAGLQQLPGVIGSDAGLQQVFDFCASRLKDDPAHDIHHVLRVAWWGLHFIPREVPRRNLIAAALLHDIVNLPKNHRRAQSASQRSRQAAQSFLQGIKFASHDAIALIGTAIEEHSYSRGLRPSSALSCALQDADRLDALGCTGLIRLFSVGAQLGAQPYHRQDPWARHRPLNDKLYTLDHFFVKLLGISTALCTDAARQEGARRIALMKRFVDILRTELAAEANQDI